MDTLRFEEIKTYVNAGIPDFAHEVFTNEQKEELTDLLKEKSEKIISKIEDIHTEEELDADSSN